MKGAWTNWEEVTLRQMVANHAGDGEIARVLGRSVHAVRSRRRERGIALMTDVALATRMALGTTKVFADAPSPIQPAVDGAWREMCRRGSQQLLDAMVRAGCTWRAAA